jgi:hypothetical protein
VAVFDGTMEAGAEVVVRPFGAAGRVLRELRYRMSDGRVTLTWLVTGEVRVWTGVSKDVWLAIIFVQDVEWIVGLLGKKGTEVTRTQEE